MTPLLDVALDDYCRAHTRAPSPLLAELIQVTRAKMTDHQMQVGPVEGALLGLLVRLAGAKRVLEIGTFTGYSALSMAEALPEDGRLVTCDIDPVATAIARDFFARSPHGAKIELRLGDAMTTVGALGPDERFDMVFIDADKGRYPAYFEALLPRVRIGGLFVADNCLWSGSVVAPETVDARAIDELNRRVHADPRVENLLLSVRDGVMIARRVA